MAQNDIKNKSMHEEILKCFANLESGGEDAEIKLVELNSGLVNGIAHRFRGRGTDFEDLVQIGNIGLLKAIRSFDISRGNAFSTYAVPMIIGEIKRFMRDDGVIKNYFPHCTEFVADDDLITKAVTSAASINVKAYIGRVATGDTFVTSNSLKEAIINRCEPLCVEMEGAAIGHACYLSGVDFVIIRCISDSATGDAEMEYPEMVKRAAIQSEALVEATLRAL